MVKQEVKNRIRSYVERSGKTQREIAQSAGISKSTLSAYVKGSNFPRPEMVDRLAEALGVTAAELMGARTIGIDDPEIAELVSEFVQLTDEQRSCVIQTIRVFKNSRKEKQSNGR